MSTLVVFLVLSVALFVALHREWKKIPVRDERIKLEKYFAVVKQTQQAYINFSVSVQSFVKPLQKAAADINKLGKDLAEGMRNARL